MNKEKYYSFKLEETLECLDYIDLLLNKKRPAVVEINYTLGSPHYVFYGTEYIPIGTECLVKEENADKFIFMFPNGAIKYIKIK